MLFSVCSSVVWGEGLILSNPSSVMSGLAEPAQGAQF